jgi:hypothetical protein
MLPDPEADLNLHPDAMTIHTRRQVGQKGRARFGPHKDG